MEMGLPCTGQGGPWKGGGIKAGPGRTLDSLWEGGRYIPVPSLQLWGFSSCFCPAPSCPSISYAFFHLHLFRVFILSCIHPYIHPFTYLLTGSSAHPSIYRPILPPSPLPPLPLFPLSSSLFVYLSTYLSVCPVRPSHLTRPPFHLFSIIQSVNIYGTHVGAA